MWVAIALIIVVALVFRMIHVKKVNEHTADVLNALKKHSPQEIAEIASLELDFRYRLAEIKILSDSDEISDDEFVDELSKLDADRKAVLDKFNISDQEMSEYYFMSTKDVG